MAIHGALERPTMRPAVIALVVEGWPDGKVADMLTPLLQGHSVSKQAVQQFRQRHAGEIQVMADEVRDELRAMVIATSEGRLRWLDAMYAECKARAEASGLKKITRHSYRGQVYEHETLDYDLLNTMRAILRDAAIECGDLPPHSSLRTRVRARR